MKKRTCRILHGLEHILDGLLGEHIVYQWPNHMRPGINLPIRYRVRWWHPASWCGWLRTGPLGDRLGCLIYHPEGKEAA